MSSKDNELKAGRPPAVKAGKMRITQNKPNHDHSNTATPEDGSVLKVPTSSPNTSAVSGALIHGHSDFTAEAVQKIRDKLSPTHEQRSPCMKPIIQQPKK